jgi:hypothetical protein
MGCNLRMSNFKILSIFLGFWTPVYQKCKKKNSFFSSLNNTSLIFHMWQVKYQLAEYDIIDMLTQNLDEIGFVEPKRQLAKKQKSIHPNGYDVMDFR